jgi:hypothetical protein
MLRALDNWESFNMARPEGCTLAALEEVKGTMTEERDA